MAKCDSKGFVVRLDQVGKLKNDDLIAISILDDLASCAKIDTKNVNRDGVTGLTGGYYNAANVPEDEFGCSKNKCYNTGTFQGSVTTTGENVVIGPFKKAMDATLYRFGMVTAYFYLPAGEHTVSLTLADYTDDAFDNSSTVDVVVHATKNNDGSVLYPVQFDMAEMVEDKNTGTGFIPSTIGINAKVTIDGKALTTGQMVGVSSIAFYEGIEDLELNKTVLVSCIDTWGDSQSFDVVEGACSTSEFDPNSGTMTASITANKWSENLMYANPALHKTDETEFGVLHVVTRKVMRGEGELEGYGYIQLSDMVENDCGFVYVQTPGCAGNSSMLTRVSAPVPVMDGKADGDKFQVLTSSFNGAKTMGMLIVGSDWVDQELNVIYRQKKTAEVWSITNEFRDFRVNILAPLRKKDGTVEYHYYENAFMTTHANNISRSDETTIELQFTIAADENGVRKKIAKITEN